MMNKKLSTILSLAVLASATLLYQNCAQINYSDENGNVNTNAIDGSQGNGGSGGGGNPPNSDNGTTSVVEFPASAKNKMTVAFEDQLTQTNTSASSDLDYNDFVMTYSIREESAGGLLKKIEITVIPQAREASYEAQLLLSLQGALQQAGSSEAKSAFKLSPSLEAKIEYFDSMDQLISKQAIDVSKPVVVFKKTSEVFLSKFANLEAGTSDSPIRVQCRESAKQKAKITITNFAAVPENKARPEIDKARYPFYLYVENTKTLMGTVDLHAAHKSKDGFPLGFQIPGTYLHPADRMGIQNVYPYFKDYLKILAGEKLEAAALQKALNWSQWVTPDWTKKLACSPVK